MFLCKKITALLLSCCAVFSSAAMPVSANRAETMADDTAAAATSTETETAEEATEATEPVTEPELLTAGDYTYYMSEEYGGAVITEYVASSADVVIPDEIAGQKVVGLEDFLFNEQANIQTVTLPDSLVYIGRSVFYGASVEEFIVSKDNPAFQANNGVLYTKDGTVLVAYPTGSKQESYTIPDGVTELYSGCFAQAGELHELTLPDGLQHIDSWAMAYSEISTLEMPDTVVDLGSYACAYMKRIESVHLSESLTTIGAAAFAGCAQLKSISIPASVTDILQGAFAGTGMKYVAIPSTVENIGYCAFGYQSDMEKKKGNFVIYGVSGSAAQSYATDTDIEYDYKNDFTFVAKTEAEIAAGIKDPNAESQRPESLAGSTPNTTSEAESGADSAVSETEADTNTANDTENNSAADTEESVIEATEVTTASTDTDDGNFGSLMKIILFALGGVVLVGGIVALVLSGKKKQ